MIDLKDIFHIFNFRIGRSKYFLPGLKRWLFLLLIGIVSIILGIALLLELRPFTIVSTLLWNSIRFVANSIPAHISGPLALLLGLLAVCIAIWFSIHTTLVAAQDTSSDSIEHSSILRSLERAHRKGLGAKIVAIGGGTGLSTLLRGLKNYSRNITAIVTVGDDGGSSGRLREELQVIPPGDIRNCIVALSAEEEELTSIFQYRFQQEGSLKGHSLGNLFLAAIFDICEGDMAKAPQLASRILRSGGKVLPSSCHAIHLCAELTDGRQICGESKIPYSGGTIRRIYTDSPMPAALPESIDALKDAELIILGPGSLYTSIIPNLLFTELVKTIDSSTAKVLYVCNLVHDKETIGYQVSDFIQAIHEHAGRKIIDAVLVNAPESWHLESGTPITVDLKDVAERFGVEVIIRSKLHDQNGRHNPIRLARSILQWHAMQRNKNNNPLLPTLNHSDSLVAS